MVPPRAWIWAITEQDYSDAVCINLDETGAWVCPLTGMRVANHSMKPEEVPSDLNLIEKISADPGSSEVMESLRSSKYARSLIFVSNASISRPGHVPPFALYSRIFPAANLSFPEESYDLIYDRGAYIYGFPKGAFS